MSLLNRSWVWGIISLVLVGATIPGDDYRGRTVITMNLWGCF